MATSQGGDGDRPGTRLPDLDRAASLAVGPLVMAVGDLLHPKETADISGQATIVAAQATRWYLAHPLLFGGLVLFVQGLLIQIGNLLVWGGSAAVAWLLVRGEVGAPAGTRAA
jgi:hypothetical protein